MKNGRKEVVPLASESRPMADEFMVWVCPECDSLGLDIGRCQTCSYPLARRGPRAERVPVRLCPVERAEAAEAEAADWKVWAEEQRKAAERAWAEVKRLREAIALWEPA